MRTYFYALLRKYLYLFILPQNSVVEIDPTSSLLSGATPQWKVAFRHERDDSPPVGTFSDGQIISLKDAFQSKPDYFVINGLIHYERDIQGMLAFLRSMCTEETRLILTYYSSMWRPLISLASMLGIRSKATESNWVAHEDVHNFLKLEGFELIRVDSKVLIPFYIPIISYIFNRYLAPLPFFNFFCLLSIAVARPLPVMRQKNIPSVSIVVPVRNEAGNISEIINRVPSMGPNDEIIFIEGGSTDDTWKVIMAAHEQYASEKNIQLAQQEGKGKGDAVRKGFRMAKNDILMILDADLTVPPEDLPKFYRAIVDGKGEFINGSRLVYPMEKRAMRFLNLIGNKFFAMAFSFVLGQRFKDTLCGTKVLSRSNYLKLADNRSYFGDFDPFGDFDLIFGAARMGLKIVEIPICYRERVYGETNISRWHHGVILLTMLIFSARRIKFL